MIKRSPKEIADFFGCYVAQDDKDGDWYMYKDKPIRNEDRGIWVGSIDDPLRIPYMAVEIPGDHDWTMLYEPRPYSEKSADSINKEASYSEKAPVSENKPAHLGEVYTHKEYCVESHTALTPLMSRITAMMNNGWKPQGGIFKDWDENCDGGEYRYYQAMVRGV